MSGADAAYNYDRYRKLLAEADDEPKRLAFINHRHQMLAIRKALGVVMNRLDADVVVTINREHACQFTRQFGNINSSDV